MSKPLPDTSAINTDMDDKTGDVFNQDEYNDDGVKDLAA